VGIAPQGRAPAPPAPGAPARPDLWWRLHSDARRSRSFAVTLPAPPPPRGSSGPA
jgi:hypothetical protein